MQGAKRLWDTCLAKRNAMVMMIHWDTDEKPEFFSYVCSCGYRTPASNQWYPWPRPTHLPSHIWCPVCRAERTLASRVLFRIYARHFKWSRCVSHLLKIVGEGHLDVLEVVLCDSVRFCVQLGDWADWVCYKYIVLSLVESLALCDVWATNLNLVHKYGVLCQKNWIVVSPAFMCLLHCRKWHLPRVRMFCLFSDVLVLEDAFEQALLL